MDSAGNRTSEANINNILTIPMEGCEEFNLQICPMTGGNFEVCVPSTESIDGLKRNISKRLKISKEKISLLHKDRVLKEGLLRDVGITNGSKLQLLPNVETGLVSHRAENSVMQALENLSDNQVQDFLTGKSPLTLAMRVDDHMMLVQIQLSTTPPGTKRSAPSGTFPHRKYSSKRTKYSDVPTTSTTSPWTKYNDVPATSTATPCPRQYSNTNFPSTSNVNFPNTSNVNMPSTSNVNMPSTSNVNIPSSTSTFPSTPNTSSSFPSSASIPSSAHTPAHHAYAGANCVNRQNNSTFQPCISSYLNHRAGYRNMHLNTAQRITAKDANMQLNVQNTVKQEESKNAANNSTNSAVNHSSIVDAKRSLQQKLTEFSKASTQRSKEASPAPSTSTSTTVPEHSTSSASSTSAASSSSSSPSSSASSSASSSNKSAQGAIVESMEYLGHGVYTGTFSGTLNPALQDTQGKPKNSVNTIIHILNDLLGASPQGRSKVLGRRHERREKFAESRSKHVPDPQQSTVSQENQAIKSKMDRIKAMLHERRQRRLAKKEARTSTTETDFTPTPWNPTRSASTSSSCSTDSEPPMKVDVETSNVDDDLAFSDILTEPESERAPGTIVA